MKRPSAIILVALFTFANRAALTAPTTLSFMAFEIKRPPSVIVPWASPWHGWRCSSCIY